MKQKINQPLLVAATLIIGITAFSASSAVRAANNYNSELSQKINTSVLSTDIRDASGALVVSPLFVMGDVSVSTSQQTSTGIFGTNSQRITVDNPEAANGGWTLTLNSLNPATSEWADGSKKYKYNGTVAQGRLTVDPTVGALVANVGTTSNIAKGASASFSGSTAITLLNAGAASDDILNVYLTGVGLSQTIPAAQPSGSYSIDMVQTVTAQ